jgi:hypothetical protein
LTTGVDSRATPQRVERSTHRGFTRSIVVLAALVVVLFTATTGLTLGLWLADPVYEETNPVVDLGFLALGTVLVGGGLTTQLRAPERHLAGLQQAFIGVLALAIAGLLGDRVEPLVGGIVLLLAIALAGLRHPGRAALLRPGARMSAPIAALSVVGIAPALAYAAAMLDLARSAGPSCFAGQCARGDRYAEAAALAMAIVAISLLASASTPGWRLTAWGVGIAAATFGFVCVALPDVPGSVGATWGAVVVVWGVFVVASAEWETRHVAYAVRHGSTKGIGERIATTLVRRGQADRRGCSAADRDPSRPAPTGSRKPPL